MGFEFGVQWDAKDSLNLVVEEEELRRQAEAVKVAEGKKLTPAQKRDALYNDMVQALEDDDAPKALDILKTNSGLKFEKTCDALDKLSEAVIHYFDTDLANELLNRGFTFSPHPILNVLLRKENNELLDFVLEMQHSHAPHAKQTSQVVKNGISVRFWEVFKRQTSPSKKRLIRHYLKKVNPLYEEDGSLIKEMGQHSLKSILLSYDSSVLAQEKALLEHLNVADVAKTFGYVFINTYTSITATELYNLMTMCEEIPTVSQGLQHFLKEIKQSTTFENAVDKYFEKGVPFEETSAYKIIKTHNTPSYYNNYQPKLDQAFDTVLGLDAYQAVLCVGQMGHSYSWKKITEKPQYADFDFPQYVPKNIVESLVHQASSAIAALWKTEEGIQLFDQALSHPSTMVSFIKKASLDQINKAIKHSSYLKNFKDQAGNNIGHYVVFTRQEKSKSCVQMLSRHNHNWLLEENSKGITIKDLLKKHGADVSTLALVEKEAMRRSMKEDNLIKRRTKTVKQETKRRM